MSLKNAYQAGRDFYAPLTRLYAKTCGHAGTWARDVDPAQFFLWTPVFLGVGIGCYLAGWISAPWWGLGLLWVAALALAIFARDILWARVPVFILSGFLLAQGAASYYGTPMLNWPLGGVRVKGTVVGVEHRTKGVRLLLEDLEITPPPSAGVPHRIYLTMGQKFLNKTPQPSLGTRFAATAQLMPFRDPSTPQGFDFRRQAYFQGIGATGYVMGKIELASESASESGAGTSLTTSLARQSDRLFLRLRQSLTQEIFKTLSGDAAGFAIVLMTGDGSYLSKQTQDDLRTVGLSHILSISGLHVGLLAGIVFFAIRAGLALVPSLSLRIHTKKWAAVLVLPILGFYTLLVGAPVPTRRSFLMAALFFVGIIFDRVSISLRAVVVAALMILVVWPQMLVQPSFQLSFAAILALIAVGALRREKNMWIPKSRFLQHIFDLLVVTFVATIATLPFTLYYFHETGLYGVLANLVAVPLTSVWLMPFCVLAAFLWPLGLASWPLAVLGWGNELLLVISHAIAQWPFARLSVPPLSFAAFLISVFGGLVFCLLRGKARGAGVVVLLGALVVGASGGRPDLYASADGRMIGWRRPDLRAAVILTLDDKPNKFLAAEWARNFGFDETSVLYAQTEAVSGTSCDLEACVGAVDSGAAFVLAKTPEAVVQACARPDIALIFAPTNDLRCSNEKKVLNFDDFAAHGSHAFWQKSGAWREERAYETRPSRPWVAGASSSDDIEN